MLIRKYFDDDVVTAAQKRIISLFDSGCNILLSFSGGKDSIVLGDIVYKLLLQGKIDAKRLEVFFVDEEGMYDDCIEVVKIWRRRFLEAGVDFKWYCVPVKHFNCLNSLSDEETFICWDPREKENWIREMPPFAITDHPLLIPRKDNYQSWCNRVLKYTGQICIMGVRYSESIQRLKCGAKMQNFVSENKCKPIYDMTDKDIWLYIYKNNLEIPDAYENMYRIGVPTNHLRISQFFSIDTAKSLVGMSEMYPDLMERITKREPNAYLCMLYWDTEMFGRSTRKRRQLEKEHTDYKEKVMHIIHHPELLDGSENKLKCLRQVKKEITLHSFAITDSIWKDFYQLLITGDPKGRQFRSIHQRMFGNYIDNVKKEKGAPKSNGVKNK